MTRRKPLSLGIAAALALALVAAGSAVAAGDGEVARVTSSPSRIDFAPVASGYAKLVLVVSMPDGSVETREFASGSTPSFQAFDAKNLARPDGTYSWELRLVPVVSAETKARLAKARADGDDAAVEELVRSGKLSQGAVQSGSFSVQGGAFVSTGATEPGSPAKKGPSTNALPTLNDQVFADDVIVQGSLCVGFDCVNNESFGFDTIRLKENNTRIKFEDTSSTAGFPSTDWQLTANDSASGGANKFSIEDITAARVPFTVTGGAANNSIFVDSTGRVGFRTSTPVLDLHVATSNTPALRLEQNSSGGFTAQTWDVAGNEANFFVRDVTSGSRLPFRIRPGAPTSSIDISASGDVGIGTASPQTDLHVSSTSTTDGFVGIGPSPSTGPALNFGYGGASCGEGCGFISSRPSAGSAAPNPSVRIFTANVERFIVDNEGFIGIGGVANPSSPIQHSTGAILTAGGSWQNGSSRTMKHDIADLSADAAKSVVEQLSPVTFTYNADPKEKHVGFIAEDVPALVAAQDRKSLSAMDIVAVLTKVVQEQQKTIDTLSAKVDALEKSK